MSIAMNPDCVLCHLRRNLDTARSLGSEAQLEEFTKGLLKLYLQVPKDTSSVWVSPGTDELYRKIYGIDYDRFAEEKEFSNRFVMDRLEKIQSRIEKAEDPIIL